MLSLQKTKKMSRHIHHLLCTVYEMLVYCLISDLNVFLEGIEFKLPAVGCLLVKTSLLLLHSYLHYVLTGNKAPFVAASPG